MQDKQLSQANSLSFPSPSSDEELSTPIKKEKIMLAQDLELSSTHSIIRDANNSHEQTNHQTRNLIQIFELIDIKKQEFALLPLFKFMQDTSIDPKLKLVWSPFAVPFVMGFYELNKYVFRVEPTSDPIQLLINQHTEEDDQHWLWFISDLKKLGFDYSLQFTDAIKFLWSEETRISRWVIEQLFKYSSGANPLLKLVIIEVLEATGNVMLSNTAQVTQELEAITGDKYLFFGDFHLDVETGHTTSIDEVEQFSKNMYLTEEQYQEAFAMVEKVFNVMTDLIQMFFAHVKTQCQ